MTDDSEHDALLLEAARGKLFGDGFFGALAAAQPDPERREKLETIQIIEARSVTSLQRVLRAAGLRVGDPAAVRREGAALAAAVEPENWQLLMRQMRDAVAPVVERYERLRAIAPDPGDPALVALCNSEATLREFAELELAGDERRARKALERHLRRPA